MKGGKGGQEKSVFSSCTSVVDASAFVDCLPMLKPPLLALLVLANDCVNLGLRCVTSRGGLASGCNGLSREGGAWEARS